MPGDLPACYLMLRRYEECFAKIPNCLHLLCIVDMRSTTLIPWTISLEIPLSTCPTLQWSHTITSILLPSRLWPMSLSNYIEPIIRCNIFFLICSLRPCYFQLPFTFSFVFPFPSLQFCLTLWLLITVLQFTNKFLKWLRLTILNPISKC